MNSDDWPGNSHPSLSASAGPPTSDEVAAFLDQVADMRTRLWKTRHSAVREPVAYAASLAREHLGSAESDLHQLRRLLELERVVRIVPPPPT